MELKYNATGAKRKELVKAISEITGADSKYLGAPTFAYTVDYFTIDLNGNVSFGDRADSEDIENLIERLDKAGFTAEPVNTEIDEGRQSGFSVESGTPTLLTIEVPSDKVNLENLNNLLSAKGTLIKKALGIDALPIEVRETGVRFPWFTDLPEAEAANTYSRFVAALCEMSCERKRISATEKAVENEKYAFRCFLLRLGFIGDEYKADRKILLRNLSGSSAFRDGQSKTVTTVCYGSREKWRNRETAIAYFREAMNGCDPNSSEYSRYEKIYTELSLGKNVCTDED